MSEIPKVTGSAALFVEGLAKRQQGPNCVADIAEQAATDTIAGKALRRLVGDRTPENGVLALNCQQEGCAGCVRLIAETGGIEVAECASRVEEPASADNTARFDTVHQASLAKANEQDLLHDSVRIELIAAAIHFQADVSKYLAATAAVGAATSGTLAIVAVRSDSPEHDTTTETSVSGGVTALFAVGAFVAAVRHRRKRRLAERADKVAAEVYAEEYEAVTSRR